MIDGDNAIVESIGPVPRSWRVASIVPVGES